ncbi:MAG TPA: NrfD/PsrC family molybdoenzyme membrane anchor subunit [Thermoanaerobaculia bacterium]|nr:NrfD/PsrC family molybdoenzyme membrane anchor subunit [Thermoanaerobaculia bacterium]
MNSYEDLPLLKPPVWTWEVPTYFFVGGAAGASAVLAAVAQVTGAGEELVRDARWIAAAGSALSAPLLISDLGRPERFLHMLRVFKVQSPMSVGAWTLAAFGTASSASAFAQLVGERTNLPVKVIGDASAMLSAATGAVMATYTGVLLGATAIPIWSKHVTMLPVHFGASALGSAVSLLELRGHRHAALNSLGLGAAIFETLANFAIEERVSPMAAAFSGPIPLALRLLGARKGAAASTLLGSLLTRFAWVQAGKTSLR